MVTLDAEGLGLNRASALLLRDAASRDPAILPAALLECNDMPDSAKPDHAAAVTPSAPEIPLRPVSVCIVTHEFAGLPGSGGIGTAFAGLAETLVAAGCPVTVLCTGLLPLPTGFEREDAGGLTIRRLPPGPLPLDSDDPFLRLSHDAFVWLSERRFDVVHFADWTGLGFFATAAKRQGLAFADTTMVVGLHGPTRWVRSVTGGGLEGPGELAVDFLERRSVELADLVVSPSRHLLDWVRASGWVLPPRAEVRQNILPSPASSPPATAAPLRPVRELVFFGRLETRKGVSLFCDALDRLARDATAHDADLQITFLGGSAPVEGEDGSVYVRRRAAGWPWPTAFRHELASADALAYLAGNGRLAVMPSRIENSPCVVVECVIRGVPFLASRVGGTAELIVEDDADTVLFAPDADTLANRLAHTLQDGAATARLRIPQPDVAANWLAWHVATARNTNATIIAPPPDVSDEYALLAGPHFRLMDGAEERMTAVARRTGAEIVTGAVDAADGSRRWLLAGGPAALGLWRDVIGPGPLLVRRDRLAAFPSDPVEWPAAIIGRLLNGDRIEVIPITVATLSTPNTAPNAVASPPTDRLAPFLAAGDAVADLARLALGFNTATARAMTERNAYACARDSADNARHRLQDERNRLARALEATVSGGREDRQRALLASLLASRSWSLSAPLRRRLGGNNATELAALPPDRAVETVLSSVWWDLAAPWRLIARLIRHARRRS